jgi:ribosome biogenesis SPOUT family RNA methylase Rps3
MKKPYLLIIEHCEQKLSEWLILEYKNSVKIWGKNIYFTNVKNNKIYNKLKKIGRTEKQNVKKILKNKKCIILDPQAEKTLTKNDFSKIDAIIVGGILGNKKPVGRTKKLISDKYSYETRNIGNKQLSIDGAIFVAKLISLGLRLKDIDITDEVEIVHDKIHSTILPYGYPILDNKPMITPGIIELISKI